MTELEKIKVAEKYGLAYSGKDAEGELQFIGTERQWAKFDEEMELDSLDDNYEEEPTDEMKRDADMKAAEGDDNPY